ncbi:hypothetical protein HK405_007581 [Cladochytrium tenue]|nr:hypothetical protein HK405_007581 [Cladochytrium tenue]
MSPAPAAAAQLQPLPSPPKPSLKPLSHCLKALAAPHASDHDRLAALALLPRLLDPLDERAVRLTFARLDFGFLDRLFNAPLVPADDDSGSAAYNALLSAATALMLCFCRFPDLCESPDIIRRVPLLATLLGRTHDEDITSAIIQCFKLICESTEQLNVILQQDVIAALCTVVDNAASLDSDTVPVGPALQSCDTLQVIVIRSCDTLAEPFANEVPRIKVLRSMLSAAIPRVIQSAASAMCAKTIELRIQGLRILPLILNVIDDMKVSELQRVVAEEERNAALISAALTISIEGPVRVRLDADAITTNAVIEASTSGIIEEISGPKTSTDTVLVACLRILESSIQMLAEIADDSVRPAGPSLLQADVLLSIRGAIGEAFDAVMANLADRCAAVTAASGALKAFNANHDTNGVEANGTGLMLDSVATSGVRAIAAWLTEDSDAAESQNTRAFIPVLVQYWRIFSQNAESEMLDVLAPCLEALSTDKGVAEILIESGGLAPIVDVLELGTTAAGCAVVILPATHLALLRALLNVLVHDASLVVVTDSSTVARIPLIVSADIGNSTHLQDPGAWALAATASASVSLAVRALATKPHYTADAGPLKSALKLLAASLQQPSTVPWDMVADLLSLSADALAEAAQSSPSVASHFKSSGVMRILSGFTNPPPGCAIDSVSLRRLISSI